MSAEGVGRCPRCGLPINGMPAGSRITEDRGIEICGLCGSEEARFQARYPGRPLPPIDQPVPLDLGDDEDNRVTDREHAQWLARLNVMNTEATYNAVVNLAGQVLGGTLDEAEAGRRLRRSVEVMRGTFGLSDLDRFDFDLIDWVAIVSEEVEARRDG